MIPGNATPAGTASFASRHPAPSARTGLGLSLSSVGMGTYLGSHDASDDPKYFAAFLRALRLGINVLDTAINYRFQRSERSIGAALKRAIDDGIVSREQVLLCTKGGFLAGDGTAPDPSWFQSTFVKTGIADPADVVAGCHCMTPAYLQHEIDRSRRNLGVETIDLYYVHNPETQLPETGPDEFYRRLTEAFRALEECASKGKIRTYGTATWDGYRVPPGGESHLSLERVVECAHRAGGNDHRFRAIQFPFNPGMPEAATERTQPHGDFQSTLLECARDLGLTVFTSAPLLQGRLLGKLPPSVRSSFPGLTTDAQRCLQFARSAPGICAPMCGMKTLAHVEENTAVLTIPPLGEREFRGLLGG